MPRTRVVHCEHDEYDVYIGRPSKWANPFKIGDYSRKAAIAKYREWIMNSPDAAELRDDLHELKGKVLGCWCKPKECHGDVLVYIIEYEELLDYDK